MGGCFLFCFVFLHEFPRVATKPSTSCGDGEAEWGERAQKSRVSEERRVESDAAGIVSCLVNEIFSELIQKTCTVELWAELSLYREFCFNTRL